jgi:hypothetical protein
MCNHLNLKILIHIFTIICLIMIIIIMRGENFVAHLDGLGGTPVCRGTTVAHHCVRTSQSTLCGAEKSESNCLCSAELASQASGTEPQGVYKNRGACLSSKLVFLHRSYFSASPECLHGSCLKTESPNLE